VKGSNGANGFNGASGYSGYSGVAGNSCGIPSAAGYSNGMVPFVSNGTWVVNFLTLV
jgi:hypothetical protein